MAMDAEVEKPETFGLLPGWSGYDGGMMTLVRILPPELYEKIMALEGAKGRACLLKKGDLQLELFEFSHPSPRPKDPKYPVSDHGISHFCIEVAGIDGVFQRLRTAGVAFHCPPLNFFGKAKATYGRDPDGNVFELLELSGAADSG